MSSGLSGHTELWLKEWVEAEGQITGAATMQWPDVAKYLRVCWKGPHYDRNCCRCQKCIRNILYFRMAGLRSMACFPRELSDHDIAWAAYPRIKDIEDSQRILRAAQEANVTERWVRALKISIFLNQLRMRTPRPIRRLALGLRRRLGRVSAASGRGQAAKAAEVRAVGTDLPLSPQ